ncbi:PREDICTED: transcription elongation factor SPT5-like [Amphimedon queenslandica]|uniref:Transcription elongation factor SPT5 n=1 Tax=Amphimedon queenslandica TaxID=400682 RepID=A0A1X7VJR0_AMPQE|nr:PREDICTED: transcription elongation factor SPT5-like [Amphimedon queenslandica]|eukprot:XP_011410252.2 PREDICTED: transcription elongation factor SPT5-like [Amphimedon queenslandica]
MSDSEESAFSEEEEEEEEEEEDDEEEEREYGHFKKRPRSEFIQDEAEETDDEEDEYEEEEHDFVKMTSGPRDKGVYDERDVTGARNLMLKTILTEENEDEVEAYLKQKYASAPSASVEEMEEQPREIIQQSLLPGVKDPNLWTVKCRIGTEKETVMTLMRKFITLQTTDTPLLIKSATAVEGLHGYIYVESYKQQHVKQAIEDIGNLAMGKWNQMMVPVNEMTDVLRVVKDSASRNLRQGSWVRIKRGIYRDDIAQVDYVDTSRNKVVLKMLPRVDYTSKKGALKGTDDDANRKRRKSRPPAKLFDPEAIRELGGLISYDGDFLVFEGNHFRNGFMYKQFGMNAIIFEGVKPTLGELEKFEATPEEVEVEVSGSAIGAAGLEPGDLVEVCEGDLMHLQGSVISIDGNNVTVLPKHEDLRDPLEFNISELRKFFQVGDHVKVIAGRHEGETGLVVRIENNLAIIFVDLTMHELKVRPRDLQLCLEKSSGVDTSGHFQLGDLVMLDQQTVGVITRMEKEVFKVLTQHGKEQSVKQHSVQLRKTRAVALDSHQNSISAKDIVRVVKGTHIGKQGEVKHVYKGYVFIHARNVMENGGVIVTRSKDLELAGSTSNAQALTGFQSPRLASPSPHRGGGRGRGGRGGGGGGGRFNTRDTSLIGKTVKIIQGPYKGYVGIVKDCTDSTARVELHTKCQTINVDKTRLSVITGQESAGMMSSWGRTPQFGAATPAYGNMTPLPGGGGRTPLYGSMTPSHSGDGGRTPSYNNPGYMTPSHDPSRTPLHGGSAWDPSITNTPARTDEWTNYGSAPSPSGTYANPATPGSVQYDNPSTPSAYIADSPQSNSSSHYGSHYSARTPMYSSDYKYTPSPTNYNPMTPGSNLEYSPRTPGSPLDTGDLGFPPDIEVMVKDLYHDSSLAGKVGVIKSAVGGRVSVYLYDDGQDVDIPMSFLTHVPPMKGDKIKCIKGVHTGNTGYLMNIDEGDGIVKLDSDGSLKIITLNELAKLVTRT